MSPKLDYRTVPFHTTRISDSGRYIGHSIYWKLYAIENIMRVIVHSVLNAQLGPTWWSVAVATDSETNRNVQRVKRNLARQSWRTSPGNHEIYFIFLPDLNKIISAHNHLFRPIIPDIDQWIVRLEQIKHSRNIVSHMNWLDTSDKHDIDIAYAELKSLVKDLKNSGLQLHIP